LAPVAFFIRNLRDISMSDWTSGYVVDRDAGYTYGYYGELNPLRARAAFIASGLVPPKFENACELGFGQGVSVNLHAAASKTRWWGTDFNPAQASFAQELAAASGAPAHLFDQAFAEFCARDDLPDFDYIGLHGIWSWISSENRALIVDFVRRRLKVGGVLYVSYNTMPGWSTFAPMRHLLTEHAEVMAAPGRGVVSRVDAAIEFADRLMTVNPRYAAVNPDARARLERIKGQNRHYLAHEYFNLDWEPMPFAALAKWLGPAKLDYACSAHQLDAYDGINLSPEQQAFLREIPDRMFRETTRDFMVNQQFRRDYWVRGVRSLAPVAHLEALRRERFILLNPAGEVPLKVMGQLGEAALQDAVYKPVLAALGDHQPKSLAELEKSLATSNIGFRQIAEAVGILVGAGQLAPAQSEEDAAAAASQTRRLNAHILAGARSSNDMAYLASPVTGGGVSVPVIQQLFLLARARGDKVPQEWATYCWQALTVQGQKLIKEGKVLETAEENQAELARQAKDFAEMRLPVLQALQVI
jgi:SAM-dependent methyltransferase